jgi:hypothetical protein
LDFGFLHVNGLLNGARFLRLFSCGLLAVIMLAGCAPAEKPPGFDPIPEENIHLELQPSQPKAGEAAKFTVRLEGLSAPRATKVDLEFKQGEEIGRLVNMEPTGSGLYEADYTFEGAGDYTVVIHIVTPDLHQTANRTLKVVP